MEEKKINEKESLAIIAEMIDRTYASAMATCYSCGATPHLQ